MANTRSVIDALSRHDRLSRAELCQQTGLSRTTVQRILQELLAERALVESVADSHQVRGRPERELSVNPDGGVVVGLELGRSRLSAVLLNYAGALVWGEDVGLESSLDWDNSVSALLALVTKLVDVQRASGCELKLGLVGLHGLMPSSVNYPGSGERDRRVRQLRTALSKILGIPVEVHSNTRLAAVAEFRSHGLTDESLVYCHLSRGVGAAVILNGQVLPGATNSAGEFGHMRLVPDGDPCHCGSTGCVETVVGLDWLMQRARVIDPELRSFQDLCDSTSRSGPLQQLAVATATALGHAIGNVCNVVNPEYVVLGGELIDLLPDWVDIVHTGVRDTALEQVHEGLHMTASRHRMRAAAYGAGLLALDIVTGQVVGSGDAST